MEEGYIYYDKYKIDYDDFGNIIQYLHYEWDSDNNFWNFLGDGKQYRYDSIGNLLYYSQVDSTENGIEPYGPIYEYFFDVNGRLIKSTQYDYNLISGDCKYHVDTYSYRDSLDFTIKYDSIYRGEIVNGVDGGLILCELEICYFDNKGRLIKAEGIPIELNNNNNDYFSKMSEYLYDNDSNTIAYTLSHKTNIDSSYFQVSKNEKKFDVNGNILEWNIYGGEDFLDQYVKYYYSEHDLSNIYINRDQIITTYPNPTSDILYLEMTDDIKDYRFEAFSNKGKCVYSEVFNRTYTIDLNSLVSGLYLYKISSEKKYFTGKFIKK